MTESKRVKELKKQQKYDRMRDMRVVEYFDYPFVLADSPVEIVEGYVLVDRDTEEIFAEYVFKNIGSKPIAKLSITLEFYYYQNIPFNVTHFEYSQKDFKFGDILSKRTPIGLKNANRRDVVFSGECFGGNVLIKLPDQRWTKTKFKLVSVAFSDGKTQRLNKLVIGTGVREASFRVSISLYLMKKIYLRNTKRCFLRKLYRNSAQAVGCAAAEIKTA